MKTKDYLIDDKYVLAKKHVEKIKGFYIHLAIYLIINGGITILKVYRNMSNGETLSESLFDFGTFAIWFFWGIGIVAHAMGVFGFPFIFGKDWEAKKIKKLMEEDENQFKSLNQ